VKVHGCALGLSRFNFGKSAKVSLSSASFAPNKSFKPTPHRGVNSVLYATLHAVATPPWGGLTPALGTRVMFKESVMSKKDFDWDNYFATASFKYISDRSPDLSSRRLPSAFSPDRKLLYLSSQDDEVETDSPDLLQLALTAIKITYANAIRQNKIDHGKAYVARTDFFAVCALLANCTEDPDEYADPDLLLQSAGA
jgi:hypothetical protein